MRKESIQGWHFEGPAFVGVHAAPGLPCLGLSQHLQGKPALGIRPLMVVTIAHVALPLTFVVGRRGVAARPLPGGGPGRLRLAGLHVRQQGRSVQEHGEHDVKLRSCSASRSALSRRPSSQCKL